MADSDIKMVGEYIIFTLKKELDMLNRKYSVLTTASK